MSGFLVCPKTCCCCYQKSNINTEYLKWFQYPFSAVTVLQYSLFIYSLSKTGNHLTPASTYSTWSAWELSWGLLYLQLRCFGCYDTYRISVENRTWQCEVGYLLWTKEKDEPSFGSRAEVWMESRSRITVVQAGHSLKCCFGNLDLPN